MDIKQIIVVYLVFHTSFLGALLAGVACFLAENQLSIFPLKNLEINAFDFNLELFNFI